MTVSMQHVRGLCSSLLSRKEDSDEEIDALACLVDYLWTDHVSVRGLPRKTKDQWDEVLGPPDVGTANGSDRPFPMRRPKSGDTRQPQWVDLSGKRYGRFTVLGIAALPAVRHGQRWVVRCACGRYALRFAKSIRSAPAHDGCDKCRGSRRGIVQQLRSSARAHEDDSSPF